MAVLIINETVRQDLKDLAERAFNNQYTFDELLDIKNGRVEPPGNDPRFFVHVPVGIKVVMTVEHQPAGKMRHMSISVASNGKLPHPTIIQEIMTHLGFVGTLGSSDVYVHTQEENCINVLELIA